MLVCPKCGYSCHEHELVTYTECRGYTSFGSFEEKTTDYSCPSCGWTLEEGRECKLCGRPFIPRIDETVCEDCLDDACSAEDAIKYGGDNLTTAFINEFVAFCLSEEEMNRVLLEYVSKKEGVEKLAKEYLLTDRRSYGDWILEKRFL